MTQSLAMRMEWRDVRSACPLLSIGSIPSNSDQHSPHREYLDLLTAGYVGDGIGIKGEKYVVWFSLSVSCVSFACWLPFPFCWHCGQLFSCADSASFVCPFSICLWNQTWLSVGHFWLRFKPRLFHLIWSSLVLCALTIPPGFAGPYFCVQFYSDLIVLHSNWYIDGGGGQLLVSAPFINALPNHIFAEIKCYVPIT